jgi:hypothetical protein
MVRSASYRMLRRLRFHRHNWPRCRSSFALRTPPPLSRLLSYLTSTLWGQCLCTRLTAFQAPLPSELRCGAVWCRYLLGAFPDRQIDDQLAELVRVTRTLGTTAGHARSMMTRMARASGAAFQTEALPVCRFPYFVATGLDPVVHAGVPPPMGCRVKPSNDDRN